MRLRSQDISQAYIQGAHKIQRDVYVRPATELQRPEVQLLQIIKRLSGLCEAAYYWHGRSSPHLTQPYIYTDTNLVSLDSLTWLSRLQQPKSDLFVYPWVRQVTAVSQVWPDVVGD